MPHRRQPPRQARSEWKLGELATEAGVSARTVRYYVQRGLLPPPTFRGPDTAYDQRHLLRLQVIQRLQAAYLPLDLIQRRLAAMSAAELAAAASGGPLPVPETLPLRPRVAAPAPASPVARAAAAPATWERWTLAPGLELHVERHAAAEVRALAERLRGEAESARQEETP